MRCRSIFIDERAAGRRADVFLSLRFTSISRTAFAQHIKAGLVTRTVRELKPSSILFSGDVLQIFVPGLAPTTPEPAMPEVLYEDDRILVVNKPAGMLVHPAGDKFAWGLIGVVKRARPDDKIDLVHRLDRETSGVLVMTKDRKTNVFLKQVFFEHRVEKVYMAIVRGQVPWKHQEIQAPVGLAISSDIRLRRGVNPEGRPAHTTVKTLQVMDETTLVSCQIHTGRTHQIRVHMEHVGFPLLGDKIYGQPDRIFIEYLERGINDALRTHLRFPRHALHSSSLAFPHPDGHQVTVQAPLTDDMNAVVNGASPAWLV